MCSRSQASGHLDLGLVADEEEGPFLLSGITLAPQSPANTAHAHS